MNEADPLERFRRLFAEAATRESFDASRAALSTVDSEGYPQVRFVLVKRIEQGEFAVFTHLQSPKALALRHTPHAALAFHWASIGVQVRIAGPVQAVADADADAYFQSRPRGSQLGAWASPQSRAIESREALLTAAAAQAERFRGQAVPRPPFWGGYAIEPVRMEFWHAGEDRLHDRFLYQREAEGYRITRLAP